MDGDTPKDGNCFFWAVSTHLEQTQCSLRKATVQYMIQLSVSEKKRIQRFLTCSFKDYVNAMVKDGTYADHIAIDAFSKAHNVNVRIIQNSGEIVLGNQYSQTITVGYLPEIVHYVTLITRITDSN